MEPILTIGIIIFTGLVFGELGTCIKLPKVTGYIFAGIILNPNLTHIIPHSFVDHTDLVTNIALAFITFSVGGTLSFSSIKRLGRPIVFITVFEAECAFLLVAAVFIFFSPYVIAGHQAEYATFFIPLSVLIASLASPTDPSATLAIEHQYHAKGEVTSAIMGVAAFDDILGIINYSVAIALAAAVIHHQSIGLQAVTQPLIAIGGSILLGILFGLFLNMLTKLIKRETEGVLISLIISMLSLCYGVAKLGGVDELLSTMAMGVVVTNYNIKRDQLFKILERYTEELIFVLFFTISAMHLDFSVLISNFPLILIFVLSRSVGKVSGTVIGGKLSHAPSQVQKYTAGGLIPQGGIVIGLALVIRQNPMFQPVSSIILNVIIGSTIIHEILGPVVSKFSLEKAGEIRPHR